MKVPLGSPSPPKIWGEKKKNGFFPPTPQFQKNCCHLWEKKKQKNWEKGGGKKKKIEKAYPGKNNNGGFFLKTPLIAPLKIFQKFQAPRKKKFF